MQKTWERLEPVVRHYTTPCFSQRKLQHAFATERLSYMVHCSARLHANLYENNFYSHLSWYIETSNPLFTGNGYQLLWFNRGSQVYHEGGGMRWGEVGWGGMRWDEVGWGGMRWDELGGEVVVPLKKVWALNGNRKSSMVRALLMLEQLQCVRATPGLCVDISVSDWRRRINSSKGLGRGNLDLAPDGKCKDYRHLVLTPQQHAYVGWWTYSFHIQKSCFDISLRHRSIVRFELLYPLRMQKGMNKHNAELQRADPWW